MKQNHVYQQTSNWQEICLRALIRDSFRCRVCHESKNLLCHSRTDTREGYELSDVITLCESCYALAQVCCHQHRHTRVFERIASLACLFLGTSLIAFALVALSPLTFSMLCLASLCIASLIEACP